MAIFTTANKQILKDGIPFQIKGTNWFGCELENLLPEPMWQDSMQFHIDLIKKSGFNSLRIPFCPETLSTTLKVGYFDAGKNPQFVGKSPLECFKIFITALGTAGIQVLLDFHHTNPKGPITGAVFTTAEEEATGVPHFTKDQWIATLKTAATVFKSFPNIIGIDLKNEPHGQNYKPASTWGMGLDSDWNKHAEEAGFAVLTIAPNWLIFVEGIEENANAQFPNGVDQEYGPHFWGGNFEPMKRTPLDPLKIPRNKLVLSPHCYGPDVAPSMGLWNEANFPTQMEAIWQRHWGFASDLGYTVVLGEWGGKYGLDPLYGNPKDKIWQDAFAAYLIKKNLDSFYWCWNPSSADTNGILANDWKTVHPEKMALLNNIWSKKNSVVVSPVVTPTPIVTPVVTPTPIVTPVVTPTPIVTPVVTPTSVKTMSFNVSSITPTYQGPSSYCKKVEVINNGTVEGLWEITIPVDGKINSSSNATAVQIDSIGKFSGVWPNTILKPGETLTFVYCAEFVSATPAVNPTPIVIPVIDPTPTPVVTPVLNASNFTDTQIDTLVSSDPIRFGNSIARLIKKI